MNTEDKEKFEEREHGLLFDIRRSIRYHTYRKRFFEYLHNISTFLTALMGTATFATVLAETGQAVSLFFAFWVTFFSLIDLIIASPSKSRFYEELARRFIALEKKIILEKTVNKVLLDEVEASRLDIEADEPPILRVLNAICHNEMLQSMGYDKKEDKNEFKKIKWHQRFFRHLWDLNPDTI